MITVKKINNEEIIVNCELIETISFSPHAVMSLTTGEKVIVDEKPEDIIRKIVEFKRAVNQRAGELHLVDDRRRIEA